MKRKGDRTCGFYAGPRKSATLVSVSWWGIARYIFEDALDVMWGQMDEVLEGYSYSQAHQMAGQLEENAKKVENLGIDEDTLTQIVNEGRL